MPEMLELVAPDSAAGVRLDAFLAQQLPRYSRVHVRRLINAKSVTVDGLRVKAAHPLRAGERIVVELIDPPRALPQPEEIPLDILYEDRWLAAINKPPGMVVHPAKGHWSGTLTAALQFHFDRLSHVGGATRPGVVHRLDRDTSGVIIIAKDDSVHRRLALQFEKRTIKKEYLAIVTGRPDRDRDWIDLPIGLHPREREKMAIRPHDPSSRPAQSFYEVLGALTVSPRCGSSRTPAARTRFGFTCRASAAPFCATSSTAGGPRSRAVSCAASPPTRRCCWPGRRCTPDG